MSEAPVLVLNAGSSSLKYQLVVPETAEVQAKGIIERIGETDSSTADHEAAMRAMGDQLAAADVDLDVRGGRPLDDFGDGALELIASADLHDFLRSEPFPSRKSVANEGTARCPHRPTQVVSMSLFK